MTKKQKAEAEKLQADTKAALLKMLKPGDTVYTICTHVSANGMSRQIDVYIIKNNKPISLNRYIVDLGLFSYATRHSHSLRVGGCGMDMGFHVVYSLSSELFSAGFTCPGKDKCHSNDHMNGDRDYSPHLHTSGGYALKQQWM